MIPSLSSRVIISDYARKLGEYAFTLFVTLNSIDIASCSLYCNETVAFISNFSVKNEFANKGLGSKMMDEVKRFVKEQGCDKIELEVYKDNIKGIHFYKKNEFLEKEDCEKSIIMSCILN